MSQETVVRPEPIVKILMGLAVLSLLTIAVCQVILVLRPSAQPIVRRPVIPMENRISPQGYPSLSSRHDAFWSSRRRPLTPRKSTSVSRKARQEVSRSYGLAGTRIELERGAESLGLLR